MEKCIFQNGATWIRGDLHLHSPLVKSFTLPGSVNVNDENLLISEYVNHLKQNDISFAAITDYQQIRIPWFQNFQKVAQNEKIIIFPGVELSITYGNGLHILLVFEFDEDLNGINDYIKSLDKNPQNPLINNDRSHRDIDPQKNIKDILQEVRTKFNCLIIFPHPNDKNGILGSFQPKEAAELLKYADAIEYLDESNINKIISTGLLSKSYFDNFAIIENTDPKKIDEIGNKQRDGETRATYYKLSNISINAIRTALQDPQMRISIYEKPQYDYDRLNWIKIEGSRFLKNVEINFNKELNCLIGGRGVGKSAILESIRYCLKNPYYSEQSFREDFVSNVVGSGGKITLSVSRKMGDMIKEYTIERIIGKEPTVTNYQLTPSEIFEDNIPIIIGQKELYHLTNDKEYLLRLIDQLIGSDIKNQESILIEKINQLKDNAKKYLSIVEKLKNKDSDEQRLKTINENIKIFQELGVVEKMKVSSDLIKDENLLKSQLDSIEEKISNFNGAYKELLDTLNISKETLSKGISKEKEYLSDIANEIKNILDNLIQNQKSIANILNKFEKQRIIKKWEELKGKYSEEINNIKKELSKRNLSADKFENLVKEKDLLANKIEEYKKYELELEKVDNERKKLKEEISQQRYKIFETRKSRIEELNKLLNEKIRIAVEYEKNKDKFAQNFRELLRGSNVQSSAIEAIIESQKVIIDGIELSKYIEKGKEELQKTFGLTDTMANRITEWFQDKEKLFELEALFPEDKISISLKVENEFKDFEKLSAGQKATALLILLFIDEKRILIIDQPEEDLDNRFIYDDVVRILRDLKRKRQIIFATHNANIPVLGDAEQVLVLESDVNQGCIISDYGSIDSKTIVENIKTVMEGGEEAFNRRIKKYGISNKNIKER